MLIYVHDTVFTFIVYPNQTRWGRYQAAGVFPWTTGGRRAQRMRRQTNDLNYPSLTGDKVRDVQMIGAAIGSTDDLSDLRMRTIECLEIDIPMVYVLV